MFIMDLIEKGKKAVGRRRAKKTAKKAVIGAAVGLTVGAVAGVLLTPKSGKETRASLANAAKEFPGKAKSVLEGAKKKLEEARGKLKGTKTKLVEDLEVKK
jgi:gas vesicle protein